MQIPLIPKGESMNTRRRFLSQAVGVSVAAAAATTLSPIVSPDTAHAADYLNAKTHDNLMDAFAGESQANRKYLTFAEQAEKEGLPGAAHLFKAVALSETLHAMHHLRAAGKVGNTMQNLQTAMEGEIYESTKMYPEMAKAAAAEGKVKEQEYLDWVDDVEAGHAKFYKKAMDANGKIDKVDYYLCSVCGYTSEGPHKGDCPVCGMPESEFFKFAG